jgi:DNA-binding PadR family transcriptional regulator
MFAGRNFYPRTKPPAGPFRRGVFKYIILEYLKDKPQHGYEIIRALEERFHGLYSPSAGTIYPRLQRLEEIGLVTSIEQDGKKIYAITEEGLSFLSENSELEQAINDHLNDWFSVDNTDDMKKTMLEFGKLAELFRWEVRNMDSNKLGRLRDVLSRTCTHIENLSKE